MIVIIAKLSFNINFNLVESWDYHYSPILQLPTQPPTHRPTQPPDPESSENLYAAPNTQF